MSEREPQIPKLFICVMEAKIPCLMVKSHFCKYNLIESPKGNSSKCHLEATTIGNDRPGRLLFSARSFWNALAAWDGVNKQIIHSSFGPKWAHQGTCWMICWIVGWCFRIKLVKSSASISSKRLQTTTIVDAKSWVCGSFFGSVSHC